MPRLRCRRSTASCWKAWRRRAMATWITAPSSWRTSRETRCLADGPSPSFSCSAPVGPKTIDTLHVPLERRGRIVEKAELMKLVWPDRVVEDVGLARRSEEHTSELQSLRH